MKQLLWAAVTYKHALDRGSFGLPLPLNIG